MEQNFVAIICPECHVVFSFENAMQVPAHCRVCNADLTPAKKPEAKPEAEG